MRRPAVAFTSVTDTGVVVSLGSTGGGAEGVVHFRRTECISVECSGSGIGDAPQSSPAARSRCRTGLDVGLVRRKSGGTTTGN